MFYCTAAAVSGDGRTLTLACDNAQAPLSAATGRTLTEGFAVTVGGRAARLGEATAGDHTLALSLVCRARVGEAVTVAFTPGGILAPGIDRGFFDALSMFAATGATNASTLPARPGGHGCLTGLSAMTGMGG